MKSFINKLVDYNIVNIVNEEFILNGDFAKEVFEEVYSRNCIVNSMRELPVNSMAGNVPVLDENYEYIIDSDGNVTNELNMKIGSAKYSMKELNAYLPINSTILTFGADGIKEFLKNQMADVLVAELNKVAFNVIGGLQKDGSYKNMGDIYISDDFCKYLGYSLHDKKSAMLYSSAEQIDNIIDIDKKDLRMYGIDLQVVNGINGIAVGKGSNLYFALGNEFKIEFNTSEKFTSNVTLLGLRGYYDISSTDNFRTCKAYVIK